MHQCSFHQNSDLWSPLPTPSRCLSLQFGRHRMLRQDHTCIGMLASLHASGYATQGSYHTPHNTAWHEVSNTYSPRYHRSSFQSGRLDTRHPACKAVGNLPASG
jgi:hypothetical protein